MIPNFKYKNIESRLHNKNIIFVTRKKIRGVKGNQRVGPVTFARNTVRDEGWFLWKLNTFCRQKYLIKITVSGRIQMVYIFNDLQILKRVVSHVIPRPPLFPDKEHSSCRKTQHCCILSYNFVIITQMMIKKYYRKGSRKCLSKIGKIFILHIFVGEIKAPCKTVLLDYILSCSMLWRCISTFKDGSRSKQTGIKTGP